MTSCRRAPAKEGIEMLANQSFDCILLRLGDAWD